MAVLGFSCSTTNLHCSTWSLYLCVLRLSCLAACGILVPRPGIRTAPPALEAWCRNHWIVKDYVNIVLKICIKIDAILFYYEMFNTYTKKETIVQQPPIYASLMWNSAPFALNCAFYGWWLQGTAGLPPAGRTWSPSSWPGVILWLCPMLTSYWNTLVVFTRESWTWGVVIVVGVFLIRKSLFCQTTRCSVTIFFLFLFFFFFAFKLLWSYKSAKKKKKQLVNIYLLLHL